MPCACGFQACELFDWVAKRAEIKISKETADKFILTLQANYLNNSFHSFNHALHVAQVHPKRRPWCPINWKLTSQELPCMSLWLETSARITATPVAMVAAARAVAAVAVPVNLSVASPGGSTWWLQVITLICKDYSFQRWFSFSDQFWMVVAGEPLTAWDFGRRAQGLGFRERCHRNETKGLAGLLCTGGTCFLWP